jgi:murein DD-endopeptidase MepM/ murein hydrolase activator NlpD
MARVPNWGAMYTPDAWNRTYREMSDDDFVRIPSYNMQTLLTPLSTLEGERTADEEKTLTAKLTYSTRFFGAYDLDSDEFQAVHPGIDIKLAEGTPIGSIAGGRVQAVIKNDGDLGLHVIVEHRLANGETYYSIYGHLGAVGVKTGDAVTPGQYLGNVGMTGFTSAPHLHLQIDRGTPGETNHVVYWPDHVPSRSEAAEHVVHPIEFIGRYAKGE